MGGSRIPEASVARLPLYLRALLDLARQRTDTVSSEVLAEIAGVSAAKIRKDLSHLGSYGTRGVGYDVKYLLWSVRRELGLDHERPAIIAGAGHLGQALANFRGFSEVGFPIVAMVDVDPAKIGTELHGIPVHGHDEVPGLVVRYPDAVVIVATPAPVAQQVVDQFVDQGITSILNFAPIKVAVPDTVTIRTVDLSTELQVLSFYSQPGREPAS